MSYENLLLEKRDQLAIVTVNRPKVMNALNAQTVAEIDDCFSNLGKDSEVRAIILTGAGEKAFVAGADINEFVGWSPQQAMESALRGQAVFSRIEHLGKTTIAAVNGFALGGGGELALSCTMRIASQNARLGQPEVKLGITPGYGGSQRLPRLIGKGMALQMILTGDPMPAEEALRWGLVNQVVALDQLLPTAEAIAKKIIANGPLAVSYSIEAVNRGLDMPQEEGLPLEATLFGLSFATADKQEGVQAFLEKRA